MCKIGSDLVKEKITICLSFVQFYLLNKIKKTFSPFAGDEQVFKQKYLKTSFYFTVCIEEKPFSLTLL